MDVNAVTAALSDLLGYEPTTGTWHRATFWRYVDSSGDIVVIYQDGSIQQHDDSRIMSADLDKLHAASQIVRRMVTQ